MANFEPHDQLTRHSGSRTSLPRESYAREEQIAAGLDVPQNTPSDVPNTAEFQATMASLMEAAKTTTAEFQAKMTSLMEAAKTTVAAAKCK
uniref:Uncharacterized protein n=1 Tax=Panagrolaimus davidi TaxID=227884 RepID=A0A914PB65_9BILA